MRHVLLAALAALIGCLAFYPVTVPILSFAAICLLTYVVSRQTLSRAVIVGLVFGYLHAAGTMYWIWSIFGPFALLLFGVAAIYFGLFGLLVRLIPNWRPVTRAFFTALAAVGLEWLRGDAWYLRFPWYTVPHALAATPMWIAPARWLGCYGLSLVIWFLAAWGVYARSEIWLAILLLPLSSLLLPSVDEPDRQALLIQTENSTETEAMFDEIPSDNFDLVVLPEYAYRVSPEVALHSPHGPSELARRTGASVIFGAVDAPWESKTYSNVAVLIDERGNQVWTFPKQRLVPLLETGVPGTTSSVYKVDQGALGVAICFDFDAPEIAGKLCEEGATVLVVPIHDGAGGPVRNVHHELLVRLRAVETDRWILRAANSGRSEAISPKGIPSVEGVPILQKGHVSVSFAHRDTHPLGASMYWLGPLAALSSLVIPIAAGLISLRRRLGPR